VTIHDVVRRCAAKLGDATLRARILATEDAHEDAAREAAAGRWAADVAPLRCPTCGCLLADGGLTSRAVRACPICDGGRR
jgi:hypothetical protein